MLSVLFSEYYDLYNTYSRLNNAVILLFLAAEKVSNVSFGTGQNRKMFPMYAPQTRFGNEMATIRGLPNTGPGCYNNEEVRTSNTGPGCYNNDEVRTPNTGPGCYKNEEVRTGHQTWYQGVITRR